jgi:hypothetical protein
MNDRETLDKLITAVLSDNGDQFQKLGVEIGKLYSDHGLPIDMALDRMPYGKDAKLAILHGVCQWLIEHKRNSGAGEKAIERQRATNRRMIADFIRTGETGVY